MNVFEVVFTAKPVIYLFIYLFVNENIFIASLILCAQSWFVYLHACKRAYKHTYRYTYILTYIRTYERESAQFVVIDGIEVNNINLGEETKTDI